MDEHRPDAAERMAGDRRKSKLKSPEEAAVKPPGDFLSDDLRDDTSRFLDEVKRQIRQRKAHEPAPRLGPPRRQNR